MHFHYQTLGAVLASLVFSTASAAYCRVGDMWPDMHDCHNFFECAAGGIPVLKTCGPGTAYCHETRVCDYEGKIPLCSHKGWKWDVATKKAREGAAHPRGFGDA